MNEKQHKPGDKLIKRYEIISYIDEGGMQEVYLAHDHHLRRKVALKTPKNNSASKRFSRSAILSAKVNHPNVAKTLDFFEDDNRQYLIEEFIDGKDLKKIFIDQIVNVDPYLVAKVLHHLCRGLAASHHVNVVHRDLKPSNVMIAGNLSLDAIKITDFGISKMAQDEMDEAVKGGDASITGSLTMVGALPYMSPEMIEAPRNAGKATDVWSIGAMLYELLSGKKPFGAGLQAVPKIVSGILPNKPEHIEAHIQLRQLGNELFDIICKCLNKDASKRPTCDELLRNCDELCYQIEKREVGKITSIKYESWGFITNISNYRDAFFHLENVYGTRPSEGETVCYSEYPGNPHPRAFPVVLMK